MFLAGHTVAMVTYCLTEMIASCSPMIGQIFNTIIDLESAGNYWEKIVEKLKLPVSCPKGRGMGYKLFLHFLRF